MGVQEEVNQLKLNAAVSETRLTSMDEKLDQLVTAIVGNGKLGLMTRVDRIEQSNKLKNKVIWLMFASIIGTAFTVMATLFTR